MDVSIAPNGLSVAVNKEINNLHEERYKVISINPIACGESNNEIVYGNCYGNGLSYTQDVLLLAEKTS